MSPLCNKGPYSCFGCRALSPRFCGGSLWISQGTEAKSGGRVAELSCLSAPLIRVALQLALRVGFSGENLPD